MVFNKSIFIFLTLFLIVSVTIFLWKVAQNSVLPLPATSDELLVTPSVAPTPFPFQELTIPYLKNRNYQSSLSELTQVSADTNYTSYLTSYQSDGLRINSLLTIPQGQPPEGGWPAVVFVHGYIPPQNYQTEKNYVSYVDYLAKNNLVILKIDLRGHGDSEGDPTGAYYSGDYVIDTLNAYSALENSEFVDKTKIYLWGHSMAGNIVLRALAAKPTIKKVVIWAGAVFSYEDFQEYRISDSSYRRPEERSEHSRNRQELFDLYGTFDPNNWFWQRVPATNYLDDIEGEIQIHHAVDDGVVAIGYSRDLSKRLGEAGIRHEYIEYQAGGHNISGANFSVAMQRVVDFFN